MKPRSGFSSLKPGLRSPLFWAWLALSALPPEILSQAFGWGMADPLYLAVTLLWWPADCFGRLQALRLLLAARQEAGADGPSPSAPPEPLPFPVSVAPAHASGFPWRPAQAAVWSTFAAEVLVSLRATVLTLAGLIPCLALFSLARPDQLGQAGFLLALLALAGLGVLPASFYTARRLLIPVELLRRPLNSGEALDASARRLKGRRLGPFVGLALPWFLASWALEGLGLALPGWTALGLALPSLAATLIPLVLAENL